VKNFLAPYSDPSPLGPSTPYAVTALADITDRSLHSPRAGTKVDARSYSG
jgi:hypothetical protein